MHNLIRVSVYISLLMGLSVLGVSCSDEEEGSSSIGSIGGGGGGGQPIEDAPVGEVETSGFWVSVITGDQFDVYLSERNAFANACRIDADTTDYNHMECTLDVLEGDLYISDLVLQYNAPPGMCDHVISSPSWFWNQSFGFGPSNITVDVDATGAAPVVTACTVDAGSIVDTDGPVDGIINCSSHPELTDITNTSGPSCIYDQVEAGQANCCFGSRTMTINTTTLAGLVSDSNTSTWGGKYEGCISPNLSNGWELFTKTGYPSRLIEAVPRDPNNDTPLGLNEVHTLASNGSTNQVGFSTWANWFETPGVANSHTHDGFYTGTTTNLPYAYDPVDDLSGSNVRTIGVGQPYWRFDCVDSGFEVRQRIDLRIREWNTLLDFAAYGTSESATYNPDVGGQEGIGCEYDPIFNLEACNDFADFDNILNAAGGTYGTVPLTDEPNRPSYFPNLPID